MDIGTEEETIIVVPAEVPTEAAPVEPAREPDRVPA
jgi:hypothetical protein